MNVADNFMEKYDIDEYVIECEDVLMGREVLKCLAYIHVNNIEQAVKIAQKSINDGNRAEIMRMEGKLFLIGY